MTDDRTSFPSHHSARPLIRSVVVRAAGMLLLCGLIVGAVTTVLFYRYLVQDAEARAAGEALQLGTGVARVLESYRAVAKQIASRTHAAETLRRYGAGELGREELVSTTRRILADAYTASDELAGICRLDAEGAPIVNVGLSLPGACMRPGVPPAETAATDETGQTLSDPVRINGRMYLLARTPIRDRSGTRIGTDLTLFETRALLEVLLPHKEGTLVDGVLLARTGGGLRVFPSIGRDPGGHMSGEDFPESALAERLVADIEGTAFEEAQAFVYMEALTAAAGIPGMPWAVLIDLDRASLYAPVRSHMTRALALAGGAVLVSLAGLTLLLRPLARRLEREDAEIRLHMEQRTAELEAEVDARLEAEAEAETRLRDSAKNQTLLDQTLADLPMAIAVFDHHLRYLMANDTWVRQYGLQGKALLGRSHYEVFPEISDEWKAIHQRVLRGEVIRREEDPFPREDGGLDWVRWQLRPWRCSDGTIGGLIMYTEVITDRKRAEIALRESEKRFRTICDASSDAITVWSTDEVCLYGNDAAVALHALPDPDPRGQTLEEVLGADPAKLAIWRKRLREVATTGSVLRSEDAWTAGGAEVHAESTAAPLRSEAGEIFAVSVVQHDVTELRSSAEALATRLQYEEALAAASQMLLAESGDRAVHEALQYLMAVTRVSRIYIFQNSTEPETGLCMNQTHEVCGPGVEPEIDNPVLQKLPYSEGFERWRAELEQGHSVDGAVRDFPPDEQEILSPQGILSILIIPIFISEEWAGFIGFDDIDSVRDWNPKEIRLLRMAASMIAVHQERQRVVQALRESEERFRAVFDSTDDNILVWDRNHTYLYANAAALDNRRFGKTADGGAVSPPEQIVGRRMEEVLADLPEFLERWSERIDKVFSTGQGIRVADTDVINGETVQSESALSPLRDEQGRVFAVCAVYRDVTERHVLEERLRQTEKLSAIGQLAGGVAHDFNNQLVGIQGYAELLASGLEDEKLQRYATLIQQASSRATDLTKQLLAYARKGNFLHGPVDMHQVIEEVVPLLQHTLDKRIRIRLDLHAGEATTAGDSAQLQNALLNMALNARDAMPDGGELAFETAVVRLDEAYCRSRPYEIMPGRYLEIRVSDTGIGMDRETQARIFEPFFTTKPLGEGTGMGLAAVYGTVKSHGGAINVYSEPGRGTAFTIHLPMTSAETEAEAELPAGPVRGSARILVVDDEPVVRAMAADMLESLGYEVATANDGQEALECYEREEGRFDLVLLDLVMPRVGGREAFEQLHRLNPGVRVLLASGYSMNSEAQAILDQGARDFIQKPFQADNLSRKIAAILRN